MVDFLALSLLLAAGTRIAFAEPFNVTVDDTYGSWAGNTIDYGEGWFDSGLVQCGPSCQTSTPFLTAVNGTWKRSTYDRTAPLEHPKVANFSFNGVAVYVNAILFHTTAAGVKGNSDMTFILDDQVSYYFHNSAPSISSAHTVLAVDGLVDENHTLVIVNGHPNSSFMQVAMFLDSIVYTTESDPKVASEAGPGRTPVGSFEHTASGSKFSTITAVLGVALGAVIIGLLACWFHMRAKARKAKARKSLSSSSNDSRTTLMQRINPFLAYKSPLPLGRPEIFDTRGNDIESRVQPPSMSPTLSHRPETIVSTKPPSYRSR